MGELFIIDPWRCYTFVVCNVGKQLRM